MPNAEPLEFETHLSKETRGYLDTLPRVSEEEVKKNVNAALARVNQEGPMIIEGNNGHDMLLMGWDDYMERYGILLTEEERKELLAQRAKKGNCSK